MSTFPGTLSLSLSCLIATIAVVTPISCMRCGDSWIGDNAGSEPASALLAGAGVVAVFSGPRATTGSSEAVSAGSR